ncbi:MAG: UDP-N-acetylglucosamine 1-carboxyvinyltransferase [Clostridia bacterium]|nr:UDP-N-acetylglucosamine 1-carboxyvinyltransferase [Clostridia bacterium]
MDVFKVVGGAELAGEVRVPGAKNAVLPILAACILSDKPVQLTNCPQITDVDNMIAILKQAGCAVEENGDSLSVDASAAACCEMPQELSSKLRSSIFMLGPMIARFGRASFCHPGGCEIGTRPIDLHLNGLRKLNVRIREEFGRIHCESDRLTGAQVHLDYPSVGATENVMMAAVRAEGVTTISNAAREPEIADLQAFLNALGFCVSGAGSSSIVVRGGGMARATRHRIMADRIVAGTALCAAAITGGAVTVLDTDPRDVASVTAKLAEAGCRITCGEAEVRLEAPRRLREIPLIETLPYPGFPTDMQSLLFSLCCVADGTSVIIENVFESRFKTAAEMAKMGARCTVKDRTAIIRGVERLTAADVQARELRGGAALTIAALAADGESTVRGVEYIDRGYQRLDGLLRALGANIRRVRC